MNNLDGKKFKSLLESAANNLNNKHKEIDSLNVFPVPDGDTGTNMNLTFTSGLNQALGTTSDDFCVVAKALSKGLLMGARGNSGVILSQIFRGLAQSVDGKASVTPTDLASAFIRGGDVAYKAVMRPVEGTILTVIRESCWYASEFVKNNPDCSIEDFFEVLLKEAEVSLKTTPDYLPVLKEVGVLDSGGAGLVCILKGIHLACSGKPVTNDEVTKKKDSGYRVEIILNINPIHQNEDNIPTKLEKQLTAISTEIKVDRENNYLYSSCYSMTPGQVLNLAQRYGEFDKIAINNLNDELPETIIPKVKVKKDHVDYAIIAVCSGDGLSKLFNNLGANYIVSGGQTMNPSIEDFLAVIENVDAKHYLILPNNSNIVLAAKQVASLKTDLDIKVIETTTIPQGLSSLIAFDPTSNSQDNLVNMTEAAKRVITGQITYSIKDSFIDGMKIKANDYMAIQGKKIIFTDKDMMKTAKKLVDSMIAQATDHEIMTIISGKDCNEKQLAELADYCHKNFKDFEIETQVGNQDVYSFIIGLE